MDHVPLNGEIQKDERYLKNKFSETVVRDSRQLPILEKVYNMKEEKFSSIVSSRNHYGFSSDFFNNMEKYNVNIKNKNDYNAVEIFGIKGKKGGSVRVSEYIDLDDITKNKEDCSKYKLLFSKAYMTTSTIPPEIILSIPKSICTETFLQIGTFESKEETENCLKYIKTKFFRALLFYNRHSLNISKESFSYIPIQNFTKKSDIDWSRNITEIDSQLYNKYNLNLSEINFIETGIKEMK